MQDQIHILQMLLTDLDRMVYWCPDDADCTIEEITHPENRQHIRGSIHAAAAQRLRFDIMEFLRRNHCNELQGYYFSRPVPHQDFAALLRSQPK